ncbi:MAG: hypothetical protein ACREFG_06735, partial [Chthoniobacterales bacterium]
MTKPTPETAGKIHWFRNVLILFLLRQYGPGGQRPRRFRHGGRGFDRFLFLNDRRGRWRNRSLKLVVV